MATARAEAERERASRERLEQQVTGHNSRVSHAPAYYSLCGTLPSGMSCRTGMPFCSAPEPEKHAVDMSDGYVDNRSVSLT